MHSACKRRKEAGNRNEGRELREGEQNRAKNWNLKIGGQGESAIGGIQQ